MTRREGGWLDNPSYLSDGLMELKKWIQGFRQLGWKLGLGQEAGGLDRKWRGQQEEVGEWRVLMPSKQSVQRWNKQTNKQTDSQTDKLPGSVQVYELPKLTVNFADGTELSCLKKKTRRTSCWRKRRGSWGSGVRVPSSSSSSLDSIIESQSLVFEAPQPQSSTSLLFFQSLAFETNAWIIERNSWLRERSTPEFPGTQRHSKVWLVHAPYCQLMQPQVAGRRRDGALSGFFFCFWALDVFSSTFFHRWDHFFGRDVVEVVWKHHLEERKEKQLDSDFFFGFFFYLWGCVCLKSARAKKNNKKTDILCLLCHPQSRKCGAGL